MLKRKLHNVLIKILIELFACLIITALYIVFGYIYRFPDVRLFLPFSVMAGLIVYSKTFGFILAKAVKLGYNKIKKHRMEKGFDR